MIYGIFYGIGALVAVAYAVEYVLTLRDDPTEPPRLRSKVPLIGHILGIITSGPSYHSQLK
jgi:hypothetical protein